MTEQKVFYEEQYPDLRNFLGNFHPEKIFLVRGNNSYYTSGAETFIKTTFGESRIKDFYDFDPNPQIEDLEKGIKLYQQGNYEIIIAIGGGSVLDMAKLISVFVHQDEKLEALVTGKKSIKNKKTPLLAIPTTAGSGAEATQFAVLYIDKKKYSVAHDFILPDYVFLSSEFSAKANQYQKACSGVDAFCQSLESVWSVNANKESLEYGLKASKLIWENLEKSVNKNDKIANKQMLEASFMAGKAINITKTTAPHALSYAFTSYYGIPHGHAVALSLPFFLNYNYDVSNKDCIDSRGAISVKIRIEKILETLHLSIHNMNKEIRKFFSSVGIALNINELIAGFDPETVIKNVNFERLSNNPRKITHETIVEFLQSASNK